MRFHLVDGIVAMEPGRQIRARKRVSPHDLLIEEHPTAGPSLAPALVIECLAQASAWLILGTTGFAQRGVLAGLRRIEVEGAAPSGSVLDLTSTVDSWSEEAVVFDVEASCGGRSVVRIEGALCFLIASEQLEDPRQTEAHYRDLFRAGASELDPPAGGLAAGPMHEPRWAAYDTFAEVARGVEAVASKSVAEGDPVFATHFPRFAVVPGVLLLHSIVEVARGLLAASSEAGSMRLLRRIQGARFRKYVRPGDELALRARVRDLGREDAVLTGAAEVGGAGVVAVRQIVFSGEEKGSAG